MLIPFTPYIFANPWFLLGLIIVPIVYWFLSRYTSSRKVTYKLSTTLGITSNASSWKVRYKTYLNYMIVFGLMLLFVALARPQDTSVSERIDAEGIDIVLSLDVSPSMDADDLKPTRLEAAKEVAINFVKGRPNDRIGLVIFAAESFTQCPATIDHSVLIQQLEGLHSNLLLKSTAIGMGLASAVNNLRGFEGKSKVVILMTDGVNESGSISPETALEIAQMYGIRVYTIGVGSSGEAYMPMEDEEGNIIGRQKIPVMIDELLLKKIATNTGGRYFRATDNASLKQIYTEINKLEKSKIESQGLTQYKECFRPFLFAALLLIVISGVLTFTTFKSLT